MNGARILMVDDEATTRLTLGTLLMRAGFDVTIAKNAAEAIVQLERQPFNLLLTNLKMPEINGIQFVDAARQRQEDLAIIVLTGHGLLESAVGGLHQGIFEHLMIINLLTRALHNQVDQARQPLLLMIPARVEQRLYLAR